jgi:hypothetical protein
MPLRVVQWTTGNVGRKAVSAIVAKDGLELVGCYAHSAAKEGCDVGELCGIPPLGIAATSDIDALLALKPDCVNYNPLWPDIDDLERILRAGVNVVMTAGFITGRGMGADGRARLEAAAVAGGTTLFGSGMNPGFANLLALVSAGVCERIDRVVVTESVDATGYASAETQESVGFGHAIDTPGLHEMVEHGTLVFGDAVDMTADALDLTLDETRCESDFAVATQDMDLGFMTIREGCVAGVRATWHGIVAGESKIELRVVWKMGQHMEPDWPLEHGYLVRIEGDPEIRTKMEIRPPRGFVAKSAEDFMGIGMTITALPAVNAIPAVCAAAPGLTTYRELPLITGAGLVSR